MQEFTNPGSDEIHALLQGISQIAVVGLSPRPARPSHQVARAMQAYGFNIIPVRPAVDIILGQKTYPSLHSIPHPVDLVNVFRAAEHVDAIVSDCIDLQIKHLWIQKGIVNHAAALRAQAAGIQVVMDRCIYVEYKKMQMINHET